MKTSPPSSRKSANPVDVKMAALAELELRRRRRAAAIKPFRGAAAEAQAIGSHEWILSGPAETGKTFGGLHRVDSELRRVPGSKWVIVRKVRADMGGTVLSTWDRISRLRGTPPVAYGGNEPQWYDYPNGSRVYTVGMDRPGKVLSGEYDGIYVNQAEELRLEDWETLSTRVTGRGAKTEIPMLCGDCNPGPTSHWIPKREALRMLHSRHEDNPTLYSEAGELTEQGIKTFAVLDSLTGVRKERLRFGRWVSAEGVVYEAFDRGLHVVSFTPPPGGRRIRAVDFGYTNPFTCQFWWIDHDGKMFLYREIYRTQRLVEDHAKDILRLSAGETFEATVADHDAEDRATLARYGISTIPARKDISVGIQAAQARLAAGRLFVCEGALAERDEALAERRRPVCLLDEIETYSWPKAADGRPLKEEPVKADDHAMDAMRYAVMYLEANAAVSYADFRRMRFGTTVSHPGNIGVL